MAEFCAFWLIQGVWKGVPAQRPLSKREVRRNHCAIALNEVQLAMAATYTQFNDDFLMALARKTNREGRNFYDYDEVADEAGLSRKPGWVEMAAFALRDSGYTTDASSFKGYAGALTGLGMQEAERLMQAAEQTVELDHSSPEYQKATEALTAVTEEVRESNEYASSEPEDREQRLAELVAGKLLLAAKKVRLPALLGLLMSALWYLASTFADAAIGELASAAIAALKELIDLYNLY
jgi:hypothetical protein